MTRFFAGFLAIACVVTAMIIYSDRNQAEQSKATISPSAEKQFPLGSLQTASSDTPARDLDVISHGAIGDGEADDTAVIQKLVNSQTGGIRFTRGTYKITKPIVIDLDKVGFTSFYGDGTARIVMAGPGPAFHFIGTHDKRAAPTDFRPNVWKNQRAPMIDGLEIIGANPDACGIEVSGTMQATLTRLVIRNMKHGIHITRLNRNLIVSDCHIYDNRGIGVFFDATNVHQANITGCHISYNDAGGVAVIKGEIRNLHITGCDIESNQGVKSEPTANVLIDCTKSSHGCDEVAITGCTIQHNHNAARSANIRILGKSPAEKGLPTIREGNITITGNILSDVRVNVELQDCRGIVLTGNTFWHGYDRNLIVENCSHIVVGSNNFDRNPRYDYGVRTNCRNSLIFRNCEDCTLTGCHIANVWHESAALLLENCRRFNVTGCTILDCDNIGLKLDNVQNSRVSDCLIRDDRVSKDKPADAKKSDTPAAGRSIVVINSRENQITDNSLGNGSQLD